ncbi:4Fe-4S dicluster domain-containing protein [Fuchsiella alkaliacetigena]|uniref:4Fe-4S dicluster domain-containing protein n=1 Tax=Fuchsiella alkaliacetigena TaxID=957042 RepID=UPI00200A950F|nr:4Fe-4S dicluster domain-containing protein [Fuchsiella alkaliacetigena]MCK8824809.1 4Fe-4S dicluster domain-containing protein [Fuchsiella alkaliacetigena]
MSNNKKEFIRPPGAASEKKFLAKCIRCGKCAQVCPYNSIKLGTFNQGSAIGTPYLIPRESPCYLCSDLPCVEICPSNALEDVEIEDIDMGVAEIDPDHCYTWLGDMCRVCHANCPRTGEALIIKELNKTFIDKDECVGCGVCEYVCVRERAAIEVKIEAKDEKETYVSIFKDWFG